MNQRCGKCVLVLGRTKRRSKLKPSYPKSVGIWRWRFLGFASWRTVVVAARALQLFGGGKIVSFDQHAEFAQTTQGWIRENNMDAEIRHAPLGAPPAGWPGHWYQLSDVPNEIDLLIVDGPPWAIHPHVRGAASSLFSHIRPGGRVLLDVGQRHG